MSSAGHKSILLVCVINSGCCSLQCRRQWEQSPGGLAHHNKRFTIEEIIKTVATRCQILRLKCTKSFVGWGSAPDPAGGAYSAPTSKGRGRDERGREGTVRAGGEGRGGERGREGWRRGRDGEGRRQGQSPS